MLRPFTLLKYFYRLSIKVLFVKLPHQPKDKEEKEPESNRESKGLVKVLVKIDGLMSINSCEGNDFIIWANDVEGDVPFKVISGKTLTVWNAWDTGGGRVDAWLNGTAIILETNGKYRRYKCNDSHPDENFDDIIFEVVIND